MRYEFVVLSCVGGDNCNGSGILLQYGEFEDWAKYYALADYWRSLGGYVVSAPLAEENYGVGQ